MNDTNGYRVYLNTAMSGIYSKNLIDEINITLNKERLLGGASPESLSIKEEILLNTRTKISELINCSIDEVVLTSNTTEGVNIVANGLNLNDGDEIITTNHEHYSCLMPWKNLNIYRNVKIKIINIEEITDETGNLIIERLFKALNKLLSKKTKIVFLSHILYTNGIEMPILLLSRYLHERNIELCVDGAQSIGHIKVDIKSLECDYFAFTGAKWLNGPCGTGGLYINKDKIGKLRYVFSGWNSVSDPLSLKHRNDGRGYEVSTKSTALLSGLKFVANDFIVNQHKYTEIIRRNAKYMRDFFERSKKIILISNQNKNGIVTIRHKYATTQDMFNKLLRRGIICRIIEPLEAIRFSLSSQLSDKDLDYVLNCLNGI
jgi:cysteine desulfurase/selenocysteine lyase